MRFACSSLLAGCLFLDSTTGRVLLVNTIEIYGRRRTLDSHREPFQVKKGAVPPTSLPPANTRCPRVWPTTIADSDGMKLVIGTKTFNALATSLGTKIFIQRKAINLAMRMAVVPSTKNVNDTDLLFQIRQVRTRFHHPSTYLCCRSSSIWTEDVSSQPYSIFTLADWDSGADNSCYRVASSLFQHVALAVMLNKNLDKPKLTELIAKVTKATNIHNSLVAILALFNDDITLKIIGNTDLSKQLASLANDIAPTITKANASVAAAIKEKFFKRK
ncbi:hypothetical protein DM01DRAFT_1335036 [Hesseltinella vesiculosa]|uniref:Uncharacterized protein n=1 Tax=Hesseltinella vesiculosa TaxID=101127 RepID=A0A1X2GJX4_9FUNG|nr:hypothetical protein DM01DRAFT_1335036 [Hesseltinella vesiculosa]